MAGPTSAPVSLAFETATSAPTDNDAGFRRAWLGLFSLAVGAWMMLLVTWARSGLERPARLSLVCLVLLGASALSPALLPPKPARRGLDWQAPILSLGVLIAALGALLSATALLLGLALTFAAALLAMLRRLGGIRPGEVVLLALGPPALAFYLFVEFHSRYFAHVYGPELGRLGLLSADTLFHAALTHMIERYGAVSTGLDGLVPLPYHAGSHVWFAALCRLGGSEPLLTYPYAQLTVLLPALILFLLLAVGALVPTRRHLASLPVLTMAVLVGSDLVGWNAHYTSESQSLGLGVLLAGQPLLWTLLWWPAEGGRGRLPLLLALVLLGTGIKVSIGAVFGVALGWVALRSLGPGRRLAAVVAGLLSIAWFAQARLIPDAALSFAFLKFYRSPPPAPFGLYSGWTSPLVPAVSVLLLWLVARQRGAPPDSRGRVLRAAELLVVVTVFSLLPSLFSAVPTPEPWWFANAGHWFALPVFLAIVSSWWQSHPRSREERIAAALLAGVLAFGWLRVGPERLVEQQKPILRSLGVLEEGRVGEDESLLSRHFGGHLRRGSEFEETVALLVEHSLGQAIVGAVRHSVGEAALDVVVFVPPDNRNVWKRGAGGCYRRPLLIPALTGLPLIKGLPPGCSPVSNAYGWGFSVYPEDARSRPTADAELCARALARGFSRVLVLRSVVDWQRNRVVACPPPRP